jgi:hypothetical protein
MSAILHLFVILLVVLAVVYGLYRLAAAIVSPWIRRGATPKNRAVSLLLCGIVAALISLVADHVITEQRGEAAAFALLNEDTRPRIVRMEIEGQQRKVICTDPAVLGYLEDCFRNSNHHEFRGGYSYEIKLYFEDGSRFSNDSCWCNEGFATWVRGDRFFPPTHQIEMRNPMPEPVRRMIQYLNEMDFRWKPRDVLILSPEG